MRAKRTIMLLDDPFQDFTGLEIDRMRLAIKKYLLMSPQYGKSVLYSRFFQGRIAENSI